MEKIQSETDELIDLLEQVQVDRCQDDCDFERDNMAIGKTLAFLRSLAYRGLVETIDGYARADCEVGDLGKLVYVREAT